MNHEKALNIQVSISTILDDYIGICPDHVDKTKYEDQDLVSALITSPVKVDQGIEREERMGERARSVNMSSRPGAWRTDTTLPSSSRSARPGHCTAEYQLSRHHDHQWVTHTLVSAVGRTLTHMYTHIHNGHPTTTGSHVHTTMGHVLYLCVYIDVSGSPVQGHTYGHTHTHNQ